MLVQVLALQLHDQQQLLQTGHVTSFAAAASESSTLYA
jgi:hypothetical protein